MPKDLNLPIRSERLVFRPITLDDLDACQELFSNPDVVRYLYDDVFTEEAARDHIERRLWVGLPDEGRWANLAMERHGTYIGEIGVSLVSAAHRNCEIGYVMSPAFSGSGLATEAARVAADIAFACMDAHRVVGRLDARNHRSRRVLERLAMRPEGLFHSNEFVKGEWCDELVFAVLQDEWVVTTDFV